MFPLLVLIGVACAVALLSGGLAAIALYVTKRDRFSSLLGGLAVPSILLAGLFYWLLTMQVDDDPPGLVILGNLAALAVVTPITMLASKSAIKFLSSRKLRKVR